jgi:hypothetical protein
LPTTTQGFEALLKQLLALPGVHIISATRVACPCPDPAAGDSTAVELQPLDEADGMRLLEAHLGPGHCWGADGADRETARQLVELVQGSPLVLSIAAGLVRARDLAWQVRVRPARPPVTWQGRMCLDYTRSRRGRQAVHRD